VTAATIPDTGLDWVTFAGEEHAESCHYVSDPCSRQATHAGIFRLVAGDCEHVTTRVLYCLIHRDRILREAEESGGLFCCHTCGSQTVVYLVRMVSL
jgi:hypothetical protein